MITYRQLLNQLGTYLSKNFSDDPFIKGLFEGQLALNTQAENNWEELVLSAYRKQIPIYHTERVYTFTLDPKARNDTVAAFVYYDKPLAYFLDTPDPVGSWLEVCSRYGVHSQLDSFYSLPLSSVISIATIVDNPINPTITLLPGIDFELKQDSIKFKVDPCADGKVHEYFLVDVKQDFKWIYKHFGYLLNIESKSSDEYRAIVDSIFGAYITGSNAVDVFNILAQVTGNIIAKDAEIVKEIKEQQVTTDKNKYLIPDGHTAGVSAGTALAPGDPITAEFKPIYINQLAQSEEISAVLLPKQYLGADYFYGIVFINYDLPTFTYKGQTRFYVGGNKNDVERFWADFEKHCKSFGSSVNEVIARVTTQSVGLINPYKFFCEHIGRYHYTLLHIDYVKYPTDLTLDQIPLRSLTPPWSTMLIQQHLEIEHDITITGVSEDEIFIGVLPPLDERPITPPAHSDINAGLISAQIYVGRL